MCNHIWFYMAMMFPCLATSATPSWSTSGHHGIVGREGQTTIIQVHPAGAQDSGGIDQRSYKKFWGIYMDIIFTYVYLLEIETSLVALGCCDGVTKLRVNLNRQKLKCPWTKEPSYQRETKRIGIWDWSDRNGDNLSGCSHDFKCPFIFRYL